MIPDHDFPERPSALDMAWQALLGAEDFWRWTGLASPVLASTHAPARTVALQARRRCDELVRFARRRSRFYARHFRDVPEGTSLEGLPTVDRQSLMAHFDDWVTDPALHLQALQQFVADPLRRGEPYLGRYAVWTSSGTTGVPGLYVSDPAALATYEALLTMRLSGQCGANLLWHTLLGGGRLAMVAALEGHFAGIVSWERMRRLHPWISTRSQAFSIVEPIASLVAALNDWQPTLLSSYPSMLSVLADEVQAGRLRISPSVLWSGGEELAATEAKRLKAVFSCPIFEEYGASECMNMAFSCENGALHLNADWVILEPVDEEGRLVKVGEASTNALLTNLCNRVQPIIRYQLGDSVTLLPGTCRCGCPLPRLRVEGRHDDLLRLNSPHGHSVVVVPLAIESVIEDSAAVHHFQVLQTRADALSVRLSPPPDMTRKQAWSQVRQSLEAFLTSQGAPWVHLNLDPHEPHAHPVSGKLHRVQGLRHSRRG